LLFIKCIAVKITNHISQQALSRRIHSFLRHIPAKKLLTPNNSPFQDFLQHGFFRGYFVFGGGTFTTRCFSGF
jgi:hypothetical protein